MVSAVDLEHSLIPNRLVFPALAGSVSVTAIASLVEGTTMNLAYATVGALTFFAGLFAVHVVNPSGMGFGDVKLALLLGWYLGWSAQGFADAMVAVLVGMFVASVVGALVGLGMLIRRGRGSHYPFGPWLALGTVVVLLLTPPLTP